jgi:hypothetical protein
MPPRPATGIYFFKFGLFQAACLQAKKGLWDHWVVGVCIPQFLFSEPYDISLQSLCVPVYHPDVFYFSAARVVSKERRLVVPRTSCFEIVDWMRKITCYTLSVRLAYTHHA